MPDHSLVDADVLVSNRRIRHSPSPFKSTPPQNSVPLAHSSPDTDQHSASARPHNKQAMSLGDALIIADPPPRLASSSPPAAAQTLPGANKTPTGFHDPATTRDELTQLLESWLDEEIPKYVLRAMDGVSDRMISRLTNSARSKLMPRLLDLMEMAQASASVAAVASVSPPAINAAQTDSVEAGLQNLIDKIEAAQTGLARIKPP
jgi:hypothetical protein